MARVFQTSPRCHANTPMANASARGKPRIKPNRRVRDVDEA